MVFTEKYGSYLARISQLQDRQEELSNELARINQEIRQHRKRYTTTIPLNEDAHVEIAAWDEKFFVSVFSGDRILDCITVESHMQMEECDRHDFFQKKVEALPHGQKEKVLEIILGTVDWIRSI